MDSTFLHGTQPGRATKILTEGFAQFRRGDPVGRYWGEGCLGAGTYFTRAFRQALFFGPAILRVGLAPGTRILDASEMPDKKVLAYLKREFGKDILGPRPLSCISTNKHLRQTELIALLRLHFNAVWPYPYRETQWTRQYLRHAKALSCLVSELSKAGFHGYGNPQDDKGVVVWEAHRVRPMRLEAVVPEGVWRRGDAFDEHLDELDIHSVEDLARRYPPPTRSTRAPHVRPPPEHHLASHRR